MQKNSLLITVVGIIVVVIAAIGFLFFMHTIPATPTSTPTSISKPSTPTPTTSTSTSVPTISSSNIMTVTVKNISACVQDKCQEFCVCIEMRNPFSHSITITPCDFKLVTPSGDYTPAITPSTPKTVTLRPGCEINLTYQFYIPNSVKPEEIVFSCPSGIKSCVPFPKPIAYLSIIHLEYTTNDTELKILAYGPCLHCFKVWSGHTFYINFRVASYHKSLPVIIDGIESASFIKLNNSVVIPPECGSIVTIILQAPNESYYGNVTVKLLAFINTSWISITKATPICAKALAEENHLQGYTYILYNFTLTYDGPCYFIPLACNFVLKTNDGIFKGCSVYTGLSDCLPKEKMYEGVTISGLVGFKVPENAIPEEIYYEDGAGAKIVSLTTTQPKLFYSIICRVNIIKVTNYTNICIEFRCLNTRGISGEVSYFTLCIDNNNCVPFPLANITISPLSSIASCKNIIIPACSKREFKVGFEFPNFSYYGQLNITIYSGTPHFIKISIYNYTIDSADAQFYGHEGYKYVVFNISLIYYGPGKFCFIPCDFYIITTADKFNYSLDKALGCVYMSRETLYNDTMIHGHISFLIPCGAKPLEVVYIEAGAVQGNASITLSPNYVSRIQYIYTNLVDNGHCPCISGGILVHYSCSGGVIRNFAITNNCMLCKVLYGGTILNLTLVVYSTHPFYYVNFTITNITVNSPFIILKMSEYCHHDIWYGYNLYKFITILIEVPKGVSYLGDLNITIYVHRICSSSSSDVESTQTHEYHNRALLPTNEYSLLLLKDEINRLLRE